MAFNYGGYWSWHWHSKFALLMAMFVAGFSWFIAKRTSLLFLPGLLAATLSGIWVSAWAFNGHAKYGPAFAEGLGRDGWYGLMALSFSALTIALFPARLTLAAERVLAGVCFSSAAYTIWQYSLPAYQRGAFSGNASMNGCLIALLSPFLLERVPISGLILVANSVLLTSASIPLGVLAVVLASWLVIRASFKANAVLVSIVLWVAILSVGWALMGETLIKNSGRFNEWKIAMEWWGDTQSPWFGAGLGTTLHFLSHLDLTAGRDGNVFLWFHNEWLQTLFELGWVGLSSAVLAFGVLLHRAWNRPKLAATLLGYAACGLFNYPLRLPIHAAGFVLVCAMVINPDTPQTPSSRPTRRLDP